MLQTTFSEISEREGFQGNVSTLQTKSMKYCGLQIGYFLDPDGRILNLTDLQKKQNQNMSNERIMCNGQEILEKTEKKPCKILEAIKNVPKKHLGQEIKDVLRH